MALLCYRMNATGEDPKALLSEQGQWTEPWGDSEDGSRCDKCRGEREVGHECWSCLLAGSDPDCPVCAGRVRWRATCPVCRGTGKTDGAPRHGVSVFPRLEGLYHYMQEKSTDLEDCVVVSLEAERADDIDFDSDQGAMLVIPVTIRSCERVNPELAERVRASTDALGST